MVEQVPLFQLAQISVSSGKGKTQEDPRPTRSMTFQATPFLRLSKVGISFLVNRNTLGWSRFMD